MTTSTPGIAAPTSRTAVRVAMIATAVVLGIGLALVLGNVEMIRSLFGVDYQLYLDRTRSWLAGGGFYLPHQLAGPYDVQMGDALYPPVAILLFIPFLYLPAPLWWLAPMALIAYSVVRQRPQPWTWPLMAICLVEPTSLDVFIYGNPTMWAAAFVAAGVLWRWPAALVAFKPTLLPFALIGVRSRAFWVIVALLGLVSLAFAGMNLDYLAVVLNARGNLIYVLGSIPLMALPLVAWVGRSPGVGRAPVSPLRERLRRWSPTR